MKCNKCGAEIAQGARFCGVCGNVITPAAAQTFGNPQNSAAQIVPEKPMSKNKWLSRTAMGSLRVRVFLALIAAVVAFGAVALGVSAALTTSFTEFPIIKAVVDLIAPDVQADIDKINDLANEYDIEEAEDELDKIRPEIRDEIEEHFDMTLEEMLEIMDDFVQSPSVMNMTKVMELSDKADKIIDEYDVEADGEAKELIDAIKELGDMKSNPDVKIMLKIFDYAPVVVIITIAVIALILILAVIFKKTGLVVLAMILSALPTWAFGGIVYLLISVAMFIFMMVMFIGINSKYKAYYRNARQDYLRYNR